MRVNAGVSVRAGPDPGHLRDDRTGTSGLRKVDEALYERKIRYFEFESLRLI